MSSRGSRSRSRKLLIKTEPVDPPSNVQNVEEIVDQGHSSNSVGNLCGQETLNLKTAPKIVSNVIIKKSSEIKSIDDQILCRSDDSDEVLEQLNDELQGDNNINDTEELEDIIDLQVQDGTGNIPMEQDINNAEENIVEQDNNNSKSSPSTLMGLEESSDPRKLYRFTSDAVTDKFEENDISAHYIGYVDYVSQAETTPKNGKVVKIVLNNYYRRRMMITAWNELIPRLEEIAEIGNVIKAQNLQVKVRDDRRYNRGSGKKYFELQEFSTLDIIGVLDVIPKNCGVSCIDFNSVEVARGLICIEGIVKNAPRLQKSEQYGSKIIGGLTDGLKVIEFQLEEKDTVDDITKGQRIKIRGNIVTKGKGLHFIKISKTTDIEIISDEIITDFSWFLNANEHV